MSLRRRLELLSRTPGVLRAPKGASNANGELSRGGTQGRETPDLGYTDDRDCALSQRLADQLQGEFLSTPQGRLLVLRREYPLEQPYGRVTLGCALDWQPQSLAPLYPSVEGHRLERALFFDTETTGLAGGSGTYAFLVGLGFFEGERFVTEQLFLRDYGDEPALLEYLRQRLEFRPDLVSFNGRTYDSQLLQTRYAMHRQSEPLSQRPHLDLLHLCRRLYRDAPWGDCRLETLESKLLKAPRHQDVPGYLIPELYFQFLRDKNPVPMKGVVEHNRRDLLALVALCGHFAGLLQPALGQHHQREPVEVIGALGRLWERLERPDLADGLLGQALERARRESPGGTKAIELALLWARLLKKRGFSERAAGLWRFVLTLAPDQPEAMMELAKWFEHSQRDYRRALILVESGLRSSWAVGKRQSELSHRAERLRRRLERLSQRSVAER